ncbi:MAG: exo-alpha-sialidase [Chloroflexi bacterium]|nr:exo-alpha-sialidase [Chloroflexota bacterium]
MQARRARRVVIMCGVTLGVAVGAAPASAGPIATTGLTQVSGGSPLAGCLGDQPTSGINFVNSEVEPWVAVDRSDTDNIVAAWQQDRWNNGGSRGIVSAFSHDGGVSWTISAATKSSICTGGTAANGGNYERASDPWVDVAPNGDMYLMSLSVDTNPGGFGTYPNAMLVMKSTDGGATWSDPTTLKRDENPNVLNDKNSLTADPHDSDFVYAVWDRLVSPVGESAPPNAFENSVAFRGPAWFSRTTDGGASWEPARKIFEPGTLNQTIGNQIVVLPNGDLIDFFDLIHGTRNAPPGSRGFNIAFIRSTDRGETWSRNARIIDKHLVAEVTDPDTGQRHRTESILPEVAVDPTSGRLYAVWQDRRFTGRSAVAFTMSTDGGATWTPTVKINQTPALGNLNDQGFTPSVHVADDGTVGVTYYDFRNNTAGGGTDTDHWLAHCHAGCSNPANWTENHVAGPFDSRQAPVARGFFLGDYMGLDNIGNAFTPFFIQANSAADPTNAFYAEVGP